MIEFLNKVSTTVHIDSIYPHPKNPRVGDVGLVLESMQNNGFWGALVVQESTKFILIGNHRWLALKEAGSLEVPVIFVDVDDDRALRILLSDNRTSDVSSYNEVALSELLIELNGGSEFGLEGTGFDEYALNDLLEYLNPNTEPDKGKRKKKNTGEDNEGSKDPIVTAKITCSEAQYAEIRDTLQTWMESGLTITVDLG